MIFFEIKSILRHRREVFVASPVSIEFQVNARLLRSLITSKLRKKSTIMRLTAMILFVFVSVGAFLVGIKLRLTSSKRGRASAMFFTI